MKEYFTNTANFFSQSGGKKFVLNPSVYKNIPKAKNKNSKILDVGCGNGFYFEYAKKKGYKYYGVDISRIMINRARKEYPEGLYQVGSSMKLSKIYKTKFDLIICIMLFPCFQNKEDIINTLKECNKVLKKDGKIIIGVPHPCFDQYMQVGILGRKNVIADFKTYYESGAEMQILHKFEKGEMTFRDYHRTVSDYFEYFEKSSLKLIKFDECEIDKEVKKLEPNLYKERIKFPTYLVLVGGKK